MLHRNYAEIAHITQKIRKIKQIMHKLGKNYACYTEITQKLRKIKL